MKQTKWIYDNEEYPITRIVYDPRSRGSIWNQTGFYRDGSVQYAVNYRKHRRSGLYVEYYASGEKKGEVPYQNGKKHGIEKMWTKEGTLILKTHRDLHLEDGIRKEYYPETGNLKKEVQLTKNVRNGFFYLYHDLEDRRPWIQMRYEDGEKHGAEIAFYTTGDVYSYTRWEWGRRVEETKKVYIGTSVVYTPPPPEYL
jgi:antitoxin component YwqK of YwqJK toxin-antitoxin module